MITTTSTTTTIGMSHKNFASFISELNYGWREWRRQISIIALISQHSAAVAEYGLKLSCVYRLPWSRYQCTSILLTY